MKKSISVLLLLGLILSISAQSTGKSSSEHEWDNEEVNEYITKDNYKADGLNLKFFYPKSWKAINGDRPHIIQKFFSENGKGLEGATILVVKSKTPLSKNDKDLSLSIEGMKQQVPQNCQVISVKTDLRIDNCTASRIIYYQEQNQMDLKIGMLNEIYIFYYDNYQIIIMFSVALSSDRKDEIFQRYNLYKKLFWKMTNRITILSQYQ